MTTMLTPQEVQSHATTALGQLPPGPYNTDMQLESKGTPAYGDPALVVPVTPDMNSPLVQWGQTPPQPDAPATASGTSSSFGAGPTDPNSPFYVGRPEVTPTDILALNKEQGAVLLKNQDRVNQAQLKAAQATAAADKAGAHFETQARNNYENELFSSAERDRLAQGIYEQDRDKLFAEKQTAIKEQTDYANSMPTDLWGASGVNKIAGIIGLALGSIGGAATGGKNMAVEAMNTLADQNMRRMKMHYDMLGDKVKGYDNTYAQLREKFGDAHAAELGTRIVMNEAFQNRLQEVAANTIDARAKANIQKTIADAAQQTQNLHAELYKVSAQQVDHAASVAAAVHSTDATHAEHRETIANTKTEKGMEGEVNGFTAPANPGLRLSKAATDEVRKEQRGVAEVTDVVGKIKTLVQSGGWEDQAARNQAEGQLKAAIVKARKFSNRVSGSEGKLIDQIAGELDVGVKGWATGEIDKPLVIRLLTQLDTSMKNGFSKGLVANGYTVTPGSPYDMGEESGPQTAPGMALGDNPIGGLPLRGDTSSVKSAQNSGTSGRAIPVAGGY